MLVLQYLKLVIAQSQPPLVYSMPAQAASWSSPPSGWGSRVLSSELKFHILMRFDCSYPRFERRTTRQLSQCPFIRIKKRRANLIALRCRPARGWRRGSIVSRGHSGGCCLVPVHGRRHAIIQARYEISALSVDGRVDGLQQVKVYAKSI